ncbi:hypothetical protein A3J78_01690 [Candidatus Beckwithbacteria bacterium RBG_13_35_6]|uniref:Glycosyltransferase RgtA/B/C/D-like domain-containing protein n=1 Tax=Candidatus Beckwithbacteria bacterium RBG_13_35_6 TaxID=1797456 RepID=A0A1F5DH37_9BACT|nr:MAG: hypothetical protein A3J78_01690 [Candidatus Beckwithbacteria bacterium RBG_13_35_6]
MLFALYSYAFLDVGLTLTSFKIYLKFQETMRHFGNFNRPASTVIFVIISTLLFTIYYLLFKAVKKDKISLNKIIWLGLIIAIILIFSYPAFSHDIFNYIFNAKMVLVYGANPHTDVAWQFKDPMLDFMRNVHTPAPYFYGWTIISLIPFILGLNRIFLELLSFKFFSLCFFMLTFIFLRKIILKLKLTQTKQRLYLFLLNPLVLIETIAVGHNDFSMMAFALISFYFLIKYKEKRNLKNLILSIVLLLFSISIKYATVVLIPLFFIWFYQEKLDLGFWGCVLLFLLPFIRPLDQLHSWYLIWPLTWIFLAKNLKTIYFLSFLSFFALLRYFPYIWYGDWDKPIPPFRLVIYFFIPGLWLCLMIMKNLFKMKLFLKSTN